MITSCICIAFALWVIATAMGYPSGKDGVPGPATFPLLISALLLGSAIALFIGAFKVPKDEPAHLVSHDTRRVYIAMLVMVIYCVVLAEVGFVVSSCIFLSAFIQWFRKKHPLVNISIACAAVGVVYFTFSVILKVPIDFGLLM